MRATHGRHTFSPRRQRSLVAAIAFAVTITAARVATTLLHDKDAGGSGGLVVSGIHLHHYLFGLAAVMTAGFLWMQEIGIGEDHSVWASRLTSALFGGGAALILDEFALLLNLKDVYWREAGRSSIEALGIFGGLLLVAVVARPIGIERWRARHRDR
jgi:hypothetical protein